MNNEVSKHNQQMIKSNNERLTIPAVECILMFLVFLIAILLLEVQYKHIVDELKVFKTMTSIDIGNLQNNYTVLMETFNKNVNVIRSMYSYEMVY